MAYNGSGIFQRINNWVADAAAAINITDTRMDAEMDGFATGLSTCVTKDGQTIPTANLPMGGFRHTNVGNSSSRTSYPSTAQLQDGTLTYGVDTGIVNAYLVSLSPAPTAYVAGMDVFVKILNTNTAASTINVDSLGAKSITLSNGSALSLGELVAGQVAYLKYNGTNFNLISNDNILNKNNTWTGSQTISNTAPSLTLIETDAAADNKNWDIFANGQQLIIRSFSDNGSSSTNALVFSRTGSNINQSIIVNPAATANPTVALGLTTKQYVDALIPVSQANISNGAVGRAQLKTAVGTVSYSLFAGPSSFVYITNPGGNYAFEAGASYTNGGDPANTAKLVAETNPANGSTVIYHLKCSIDYLSAGTVILTGSVLYITASRPYNLGDGDIPLFIFAEINPSGKVVSAYCAPEAPWHYNGPTNIKSDYYKDGKGFQYKRQFIAEHGSVKNAITKGMSRAQALDELALSPMVSVEITQSIKNADMSIIPHPFSSKAPGNTIILIDPVSYMCEKLCAMHESGESVLELLNEGYITLGSNVKRFCPMGVNPISVKWKLTK